MVLVALPAIVVGAGLDGGESNGDAIQVRFAMIPRGTAEPCPSGRPNSFRGGENHHVCKITSILRSVGGNSEEFF